MSVKRYEWVACDEHSCHCDVVESAEGDMVDYDDYAALEARCAALAAENAGLKNALEWLYEAVSMPDSGPIPDKYYSAVTNAAAVMHETPATDASLAEVRAQGVEIAISQAFREGIPVNRMQFISRMMDFAAQLRQGGAE